MRTRLKVGLLAAVMACAAIVAAKAEEDRSYLPPEGLQGKGETTVPKTRAPKTAQAKPARRARVYTPKRRVAAVRHYRRTRVAYRRGYHRVAHHRRYHRYRYAYYRPVFPLFLFNIFRW